MRKKIMLWILAIVLLFLFVVLGTGWWMSGPGYQGPVSDHFNGKTFFNPDGAKAKGIGDLLKWGFSRKPGSWEPFRNIPFGPPPPDRVEVDSLLRLTFINHATVLLQIAGKNILTDPIWSQRASPFGFVGPNRTRPPGIRFEDLPPIDFVLLSHNHYDHLDLPTLKKLSERDNPTLYVPLGVKAYLDRHLKGEIQEMDWWDELSLGSELKLVCTPAQHFSARGMFDRDQTLWAGFLIQSPVGNLLFAGDTGYASFFQEIKKRYGPTRLAMLPIGAYLPIWFMKDIHMSPAQAVQAHLDLEAQQSMAVHFGTFPLADDGQEEPQEQLQTALHEAGLHAADFWLPEAGKGVEITP